jgi:hypothetical protein
VAAFAEELVGAVRGGGGGAAALYLDVVAHFSNIANGGFFVIKSIYMGWM